MSLISKIKAMSLKAKIFSALGILLAVVLLTNCKLVGYGITQGLGQLRMVRNAVPIDTLLNDPSYPDSLKQKLLYTSVLLAGFFHLMTTVPIPSSQ